MKKLKYTRGSWKYLLEEDAEFSIENQRLWFRQEDGQWLKHQIICNGFLSLSAGKIRVHKGYCWDGPSGPTIDTEDSLRASLFHDALYQAMQAGVLPYLNRKRSDRIFRSILKEDGMSYLRRSVWYTMIRIFGGYWLRNP